MNKELFLTQFMAWLQLKYFYVQHNLWKDVRGDVFTYPEIIKKYLKETS